MGHQEAFVIAREAAGGGGTGILDTTCAVLGPGGGRDTCRSSVVWACAMLPRAGPMQQLLFANCGAMSCDQLHRSSCCVLTAAT